jgi:hypothetical protein
MSSQISAQSNIDRQSLSREILKIKDAICSETVEKAKRLSQEGLSEARALGKAVYLSDQAYDTFKDRVFQSFPGDDYEPFVSLAFISLEKAFCYDLKNQIQSTIIPQ